MPASRRHSLILLSAWAVLSIVGVLVALNVPMPPGDASSQAAEGTSILRLETVLATPVMIGVLLYVIYTAFVFRARGASAEDGPPQRGDLRLQVAWVGATAVIVFALAGVGITSLANSANATDFTSQNQALGTSGVTPVGSTGGQQLQVQVIAQQWYFTYRYPGYGGAESSHLVLPVNANVVLHITSLDVIHSFWAYELGVKADANPGVDNVTYLATQHTGSFTVRCAELCGIWHGNMFDREGQILSQADFATWVGNLQAGEVQSKLPPYAPVYYPSPRVKGS